MLNYQKLFVKNFRENVRKKGLTQEELAATVGVSRAYIGYIEQGHNTPSLEVIEKITRVLKIEIVSFF